MMSAGDQGIVGTRPSVRLSERAGWWQTYFCQFCRQSVPDLLRYLAGQDGQHVLPVLARLGRPEERQCAERTVPRRRAGDVGGGPLTEAVGSTGVRKREGLRACPPPLRV